MGGRQRRGILLAHLARIAAQARNLTLAKQTLARLKASSDLRNTPGCEAAYHQARAEIAFADKQHERAIGALRDALAIWIDAGSRINAAHARLRLAEILAATGDLSEAELELASAEKAFAAMDADLMVARCKTARKKILSAG